MKIYLPDREPDVVVMSNTGNTFPHCYFVCGTRMEYAAAAAALEHYYTSSNKTGFSTRNDFSQSISTYFN